MYGDRTLAGNVQIGNIEANVAQHVDANVQRSRV